MSKILGIGIGVLAFGAAAILLLSKKSSVGETVAASIEKIETAKESILSGADSSVVKADRVSNAESERQYYLDVQEALANPRMSIQPIGNATVYSPSRVSSAAATVMNKQGGSYVAVNAPSGTTMYRKVG